MLAPSWISTMHIIIMNIQNDPSCMEVYIILLKQSTLQSTFVILYIMIHLENARWDSSRINLIAKVRVSQKWKRRLRAKVKLFRAELWQILEKGLSDKWKMIMEIQYQWRSHTPTFKWVSEGQDGMENHHKIMNIISMR